jgi:hypothetical protein
MAYRIISVAKGSLILLLSLSKVGKRMAPKPKADTSQSKDPNLRYCIASSRSVKNFSNYYTRVLFVLSIPYSNNQKRFPNFKQKRYMKNSKLTFFVYNIISIE